MQIIKYNIFIIYTVFFKLYTNYLDTYNQYVNKLFCLSNSVHQIHTLICIHFSYYYKNINTIKQNIC